MATLGIYLKVLGSKPIADGTGDFGFRNFYGFSGVCDVVGTNCLQLTIHIVTS